MIFRHHSVTPTKLANCHIFSLRIAKCHI